MDKLVPLLMNVIEEKSRPHVQAKVTEELDSTKVDLKEDLPNTIIKFLSGEDGSGGGNPLVGQIISKLGPSFTRRLASVTNTTVDTASEGMDILLTNGVINIAKKVLTKQVDGADTDSREVGGLNFEAIKSGKEGMVKTTMAASAPVIKQVSDNMGNKISSSFPAVVGGAVQEMIDENGGEHGLMGMAAGLMTKLMSNHGHGDRAMGGGGRVVGGGGDVSDIRATGGHTGGIQEMLQNLLAPKILLLLQPYLQKFEAKMTESLEKELRTKVFSSEYIKQTVVAMLTGAHGEGASGSSALIGGIMSALGHGKEGKEGKSGQTIEALSNLASSFLKHKSKHSGD
ncbi:hypothetical protein BGX21_009326 [Mortierella sp. AD011]|nr:hypothetical protein BGX20_008414 [Mortierella sp. AD010]KAF9397049.1 hypothetical protein BGX21_009326 [Mortierella sp. AD011]